MKVVGVTGFRGLWPFNVGATGLGGLWVLEWTWQIRVTNFRCVQGYGTLLLYE